MKKDTLRLTMPAIEQIAYRIGQGIAREVEKNARDISTVINVDGTARPYNLGQLLEHALRGAALSISAELYYEGFHTTTRERLRYLQGDFTAKIFAAVEAGYKG